MHQGSKKVQHKRDANSTAPHGMIQRHLANCSQNSLILHKFVYTFVLAPFLIAPSAELDQLTNSIEKHPLFFFPGLVCQQLSE